MNNTCILRSFRAAGVNQTPSLDAAFLDLSGTHRNTQGNKSPRAEQAVSVKAKTDADKHATKRTVTSSIVLLVSVTLLMQESLFLLLLYLSNAQPGACGAFLRCAWKCLESDYPDSHHIRQPQLHTHVGQDSTSARKKSPLPPAHPPQAPGTVPERPATAASNS